MLLFGWCRFILWFSILFSPLCQPLGTFPNIPIIIGVIWLIGVSSDLSYKKSYIKSNFSTNLWPSRQKNKERPKLIRFEEGRTIKDEILSRFRQRRLNSQMLEHHRHLQNSTSHNIRLNLPIAAFDGSCMIRESPHHQFSTFSTQAFSFPVGLNFGWPRKSVTHLYQHKYWNIFISWFYYHSAQIKFPKINLFLRIQQLNILLLNFTHIFIFTNTIIWTFCFFLLC